MNGTDSTGLLVQMDNVSRWIEQLRLCVKFPDSGLFMRAAPQARDAIEALSDRLKEMQHVQLDSTLRQHLHNHANGALDTLSAMPVGSETDISDMCDSLRECCRILSR